LIRGDFFIWFRFKTSNKKEARLALNKTGFVNKRVTIIE